MPFWTHTLVGFVVVAVLGAAAWRLAGRTTPGDPVVRLLGAALWWWLGVQVSGLATQLPIPGGVGLDAALVALVLAGLVLWRVPAPGVPSARADRPAMAMLTALGAGGAVLTALMLLRPAIGLDGLGYHLPLPAAWVPQGALGGRPTVIESLPIEAYPVGSELVAGWLIAVLGSTAAGMLVGPFSLVLLCAGTWSATRRLGGGPAAAWGAVATVALSIPTLLQATQSASDLPAAALLAAAIAVALDGAVRVRVGGAALGGASPDRPESGNARAAGSSAADAGRGRPSDDGTAGVDALLLGVCGVLLAIGAKTHAACGLLVLALLLWRLRTAVLDRLRARRWWLAAVGLAVLAGGVWLARNAILHGHPSWPLAATSFGDPVPDAAAPYLGRFVDHPGRMLEIAGDRYARQVWFLPLLVVASVAAIVRGDALRRIVGLTGVLGLIAWSLAPATGITALNGQEAPDFSASAVRYLGPAIVLLAAAGWSMAGRGRTRERWIAGLAVATAVVQATLLVVGIDGWFLAPVDATPATAGLVAAGATALVLGLVLALPATARIAVRPPVPAVVGLLGVLLVVVATPGFWSRHAELARTGVPPTASRPVLALAAVPAWTLGATGEPGGELVGSCDDLVRGLAAGRTVAIPTPLVPTYRCGLPDRAVVVDDFSVWAPAGAPAPMG
jgi:hypothetical protein